MMISVIIPCYNAAPYIHECLDSVLAQSVGLENLEIILIDDCSTDQTVSIIRSYEAKYPDNILLILSEKNGKQGYARNIGLKYATGDYVSFVDADDFIHPRMYEILLQLATKHKTDLLQFRYIDSKKSDPGASLPDVSLYDFSTLENRKKYILRTNIVSQSCTTLFYRHDLIRQANVRFAEGVAYEEPLFTYPLQFYANSVAVLEYPLYYYRYNSHGTTASYMNNPSTITDHISVQTELLSFMRSTHFYTIYRPEIELYFLHSFFVEPFYFLQYRGTYVPPALFRYLSEKVKEFIPDYLKNPYLSDPSLTEEVKLIALIQELSGKSDTEISEKIRSLKLV